MNKGLIIGIILAIIILAIVAVFIINPKEEKSTPIQLRDLAEICYQASLNKDFQAYLQFRDLKLESGIVTRANCNVGGVDSSFSQGIKGYLESKLGRGYWKAAENINEEGSDIKECNRLIDKFTINGKTECNKVPRVNGLSCTKEIWEYNTLNDDQAFPKDSPFNTVYLKNTHNVTCS